jgi:hypothetical protein
MKTLLQTQQDFLDYLLAESKHFEQDIIGTERFNKQTRLGIYADAYASRLIEALQDNYPALHTLMGDCQFNTMANHYLEKHPSQNFSVRHFGHQLDQFLQQEDCYKTQPVFAEMATFEWALRAAFDAADQNPISIATLQKIPIEQWGEMRFSLHDSVHRLNLEWNVAPLWLAIENKEEAIPAEKNDYPIAWRIWREQELKIFYKSLAVDEAWALDAIIEQRNFADICAGLCEWVDEQYAAQRAVTLIQTWINDGLIIKVSV